MNSQIEKTELWKKSLGSLTQDNKEKREQLRSVLQKFRDHIATLTTRIAAEFPELTIHDVTHLDALWETADLIAGADYPLNPMEAFVLGGAILLHDAAHCFEAFEGGIQTVRNTIAWKDSYAAELSKNPHESSNVLERHCDFAAIRLLHGRQAENLALHEWKSPNDQSSFFLIEDADLRARYGSLIGKIAASHNWSIDDLSSQLLNQFNAPGGWPSDWRVDPIKIACILRCADAAHLDERRAPDFLFALIRRSGLSLEHWKAQNWLARADIDQSDPTKSSLLITSTRAFQPSDNTAWWVAYDAITVLDAEINACNQLLLSRTQCENGSPAFKIKKVTGANSPLELSKFIEVKNWQPTTAKIHVGNLEKLVETLGGRSLYGIGGDDFAIVIRELIQNARDAIAARRALAPNYSGSILIKITKKSETQTYVVIQDDGVGMSERTMLSTLLDFGTSFWATDLVKSEFPGLKSSSFKPVGKYGIGFYAVFMVATEVLVSSRRYDAGISDVTNLHFPDGLTLRPILSKAGDSNFEAMSSTSIRLTIDAPIDFIKDRLMNEGSDNECRIPLQNYLAAITAGLDTSVKLQIDDTSPIIVHENIHDISTEVQIRKWIGDLTFIDVLGIHTDVKSKEYILQNYSRIRKIEHHGQLLGFAALLDSQVQMMQFITTDTIGGLTNQVMRGAGSYLGYMENYSASAKRDVAKKVIPIDVLQTWADEQISLLAESNATAEQLYWAASNMANLDLDPIEIINFPVLFPTGQYVLIQFDQLFLTLQQTALSCLIQRQHQFCETHMPPVAIDNLPTLRPLSPGNLIRCERENNRPKFPTSLIGCLDRLVRQKGRELIYEVKPNVMGSPFGMLDCLIIKLKNH